MAKKKLSFGFATINFLCIITFIFLGVFVWKSDLHGSLVLGLTTTILSCLYLGYSWAEIQEAMGTGVIRAMGAMFIFIMIGMIIGSWIVSGTIPALVYYGLDFLTPALFLPLSLLLCSFMSLATGTSWGTVSSIGIALIAIGEGLGIPLPLTAGVIISGACFGDKMSPVSDTTNLAAISAQADLYQHIRTMMLTTVPTFIICLVIYTCLGMSYQGQEINLGKVVAIQETIQNNFSTNLLTLLPIFILLALSLAKVPALPAMACGVISAIFVAVIIQDASIQQVMGSLNNGYKGESGNVEVDKLLNRGGIQSMMWTFSLAVIALALGGILEKMRFMEVIVVKIIEFIKGAANLVSFTIASCVLSNMAMGEAYLSIILNGQLYKDAFDDENLENSMLSRSLEEGATLSAAIIPWTTAGAYFAGALGVGTFEYLPYAFLNWLNPIVSIVLAYCGIFVLRKSTEK